MSGETMPAPADACPGCGMSPHAEGCPRAGGPGPLTGVVDGRYVVEREIGRGGMGVIALARDTGLDRRVALKVMAAGPAGDPAFLLRFQREAASLARVRSENVVHVYAFGMHDGSPFFVMEYVDGEDLSRLLDAHLATGALIARTVVLSILEAVASGLDAAHAAGILHCDVKPANVVVENGSGRPVLVDFGLAVSTQRPRGGDGQAFGTPAYMSPEQVRGDRTLTAATDQYSLACSAFELLTGHLPHQASSTEEMLHEHLAGVPSTLSAYAPDLAGADPVMSRALAKDASYRFTSCREFVVALVGSGIGARSTAEPPRPAPRTSLRDGLHVLVVDDDPTFSRLAARAAQIAFYRAKLRVDRAADVAAVDALASAPDLVLLDHNLPGVDGVETLTRLRALDDGYSIRVLVMSARIPPEARLRYRALGVDQFVEKPTDLGTLVQKMQEMATSAGWGLAATGVS